MGSLRSGAAELCAESEAPCIEADVWSLHLGPGARVLEQAAADAVYTVPCCQKGEVRMWKGVSHSGKRGAAQTGPQPLEALGDHHGVRVLVLEAFLVHGLGMNSNPIPILFQSYSNPIPILLLGVGRCALSSRD